MLKAIVDLDEERKSLDLLAGLVSGVDELDANWLSMHRWAAVPAESASHFTPEAAEAIARIARSLGYEDLLGLITDPLEESSRAFMLSSTSGDLLEFSWQCGSFNCLIIPADRGFAILCAAEGYYIVAGPRQVVQGILGPSLSAAREKFRQFASDDAWPEGLQGFFKGVAARYSAFEGGAD